MALIPHSRPHTALKALIPLSWPSYRSPHGPHTARPLFFLGLTGRADLTVTLGHAFTPPYPPLQLSSSPPPLLSFQVPNLPESSDPS
eukprot:746814-Hanusia_phi.AAC.1